MVKPESISIDFHLGGWDIYYSSDGHDVGQYGPDMKPYKVEVWWYATREGKNVPKENRLVTGHFDTLKEANEFIEKETELKYE